MALKVSEDRTAEREHVASSSSSMGHEKETTPSGMTNIKSAEDRKTAAALSSMDDNSRENYDGVLGENNTLRNNVDQEAVRKAMERLNRGTTARSTTSESKIIEQNNEAASSFTKSVKVDANDVTFIVEELELSKNKSTSLLKTFGGDVQKAIRSYLHSD